MDFALTVAVVALSFLLLAAVLYIDAYASKLESLCALVSKLSGEFKTLHERRADEEEQGDDESEETDES